MPGPPSACYKPIQAVADLAAADELYDLKLRAGAENRFGPEGLLDNATVQFHGDARGV
jgi:hypothetical protein